MLARMLQHISISLPAPKSTGRDLFNEAWLNFTAARRRRCFSRARTRRPAPERTGGATYASGPDCPQHCTAPQARVIFCVTGSFAPSSPPPSLPQRFRIPRSHFSFVATRSAPSSALQVIVYGGGRAQLVAHAPASESLSLPSPVLPPLICFTFSFHLLTPSPQFV